MHFEVYTKYPGYKVSELGSTTTPTQYPCVELVHNDGWNDYDYKDWYGLWYFVDPHTAAFLGDVKIMTRQEKTTSEALGKGFEGQLDDSFCSLGLNTNYYANLYQYFEDKGLLYDLMRNLRDCAYEPRIYEEFCELYEFRKALMREMSSQEAQKFGWTLLNGRQLGDAYIFSYLSRIKRPDESMQDILLNVQFPFECPDYKRTMCIIGENGMGKTQLLCGLTESLVNAVSTRFNKLPLFNGCLVICSTPYDKYPPATPKDKIHYLKISVEQTKHDLIDELGMSIELIKERPSIGGKNMIELYYQTIVDQIGEVVKPILEWVEDPKVPWEGEYVYRDKELRRVIDIMSSGQLHLFSLITQIYTNIHFSTLLIIDEPEVHLHPHTVVEFMKILANILTRFRSFAIIATHSPLIVREVISKNVQVLQEVDNHLQLVSVPYNTFGEDITTLYYKIFDYDIKDSFFTHVIKQMIWTYELSYEQIIQRLGQEVDLSLNALLTIRDLVDRYKRQ